MIQHHCETIVIISICFDIPALQAVALKGT